MQIIVTKTQDMQYIKDIHMTYLRGINELHI